MALPRTQSVAVRTDDVALRCLGQDLAPALEGGSPGAEGEALLSWISMVEVHLVTGEPAAAIGTGHFAELAEKRSGRYLARPDAIDFLLTIRRVVGDIRRALARSRAHAPF
jgi:hypothetical protein